MTDRFPLAQLPTPLERMSGLEKALGIPPLWIKRDDQTGLALGGNKTRKLEFLIADAMAQHADVILTAGAPQSNHCRQTAAAAVRAGIACEVILGGTPPAAPNGNLLLDELLGAKIHWTDRTKRLETMEEIAAEYRKAGKRPYVIPYGGSNGMGAQGYVLAMKEIVVQMKEMGIAPGTMLVASSSGGTQAGLTLGAKLYGYQGQIIGISIDKGERGPERYEEELAVLANATAEVMKVPLRLTAGDFHVDYGYLGDGYGIVGDVERRSIHLLAKHEGILLDPVYTGRAFGAVLKGRKEEGVGGKEKASGTVFWHTGGAVALFSYGEAVRSWP
jgi:D-cysteine desulfhydrase